ncbi:iron ABC transporter ATP-binding protein [Agromyces mariniharenae]|uniref:Iron ABC transporter ATP-binding protein n=1 Tax=Agromyces mariniharenae TaxID=2604423 RepID=A0A5S4V772_9MICO|nr:iron ABC transporter ATP-binding protein [Agromyces mariniharenae]TYL52430.1 iron ABC transporter ATP-binding protein [Agromyces mariniharenae]
MPRSPHLARTRPAGLALVAAASVALLAGCTPDAAEPTGTAAATTSPSDSATAAPEPTESAEPPVPFEIACDALLTADQLYAYNPNVGADPGYEPDGDDIATLVDEDAGTACGYLNQTSGEVIEVGVATPTTAAGEERRNQAALSSKPVPTYGTPPDVEGYFTQAGGTGEAQVFHGPYWIVIQSPALFEPGDAAQLVASVIANLPAA